MITTKEEVYNIKGLCSHYRPEKYLAKYKFSKEILLDVFCSEDLVYCFEDYYYDDISLPMIQQLQSHIDISEFENLWSDLDEIRTIELFCDIILTEPKLNLSTYKYNLISNYLDRYDYGNYYNELLKDLNKLLESNKFALKYNFNTYLPIMTKIQAREIATSIIKLIPSSYSSILPL